jgi:hypothetical protein
VTTALSREVELAETELMVSGLRQIERVVPAMKAPAGQHPVPTAWRQRLEEVVQALVDGDYRLDRGVPGVLPVSDGVAKQIQSFLGDHGEALDALPDDTWSSSAAQWMEGHWDVLVDLWTRSGPSDLALSARVYEEGDDFVVEVSGVYVP